MTISRTSRDVWSNTIADAAVFEQIRGSQDYDPRDDYEPEPPSTATTELSAAMQAVFEEAVRNARESRRESEARMAERYGA